MTTHAYCRISTTRQEDGYGIDVQQAAVERYAQDLDLDPATSHTETGSGESMKERTVLQEMLQVLAAGDHLIIYRLDRLSRSLMDLEWLLGLLIEERGVVVHSCQASERDWLDPARFNDPQTRMMRRIMGAIVEYDRSLVIQRMQSGVKAKAASGGFTGGKPPFGYRIVDNDRLEPDPAKVDCVRAVVTLHRGGCSSEQVRQQLLANWHHVKAYGKDTPIVWSEKAVSRVLALIPLYTKGEYRARTGEDTVQRPELIIAP
jgi:site-specific DNA recombinase